MWSALWVHVLPCALLRCIEFVVSGGSPDPLLGAIPSPCSDWHGLAHIAPSTIYATVAEMVRAVSNLVISHELLVSGSHFVDARMLPGELRDNFKNMFQCPAQCFGLQCIWIHAPANGSFGLRSRFISVKTDSDLDILVLLS